MSQQWSGAMRRWTLVAATALLATGKVALADGLAPPAACCAAPTWSGVYAGFQAGGAWSDTGWTFPFAESFNTAPGQHFATQPGGGLAGGQVGFNQQLGGIVLGGELAFVGTEARQTLTAPAMFADDRFKTSFSDLLTLTARAGIPLGNSLLYAKAGYADAHVDLSAFSTATGISGDASRTADGWTAGAGWEYRIGRSLVFGVEYDYVDLSASRFSGTTGGAAPGLPFKIDLDDLHAHMVVARLSILLDRGPTAAASTK
jgi:outer membrane immunogenic protein